MSAARIAGGVRWAGVALRLDDGTLYTYELECPRVEASITAEEIDVTTLGGPRRFVDGRSTVELRILGEYVPWRDFDARRAWPAARLTDPQILPHGRMELPQ